MSNITPTGKITSPSSTRQGESLAKQLHDLFFEHKIDGVVVGVEGIQKECSLRAQQTAQRALEASAAYLPSFATKSTSSEEQKLGGDPPPTDLESLRERRIRSLTSSNLESSSLPTSEEVHTFSARTIISNIAALLNYRGFTQKLCSDLLVGFSGEDMFLAFILCVALSKQGESGQCARVTSKAFY